MPQSRSVELQLDPVAGEARRVGGERDLGRRAGRGAGADVEAALVQRALDLVAFEQAVAQARVAVRAEVVGREDGAVDEVDRDLLAGDDDSDRVAGGEVVERRDRRSMCLRSWAVLRSDR